MNKRLVKGLVLSLVMVVTAMSVAFTNHTYISAQSGKDDKCKACDPKRPLSNNDIGIELSNKGEIMVVEGSNVPTILIGRSKGLEGNVEFRIHGNSRFADGYSEYSHYISNGGDILLPTISSGNVNDEDYVNVYYNDIIVTSYIIHTIAQKDFDELSAMMLSGVKILGYQCAIVDKETLNNQQQGVSVDGENLNLLSSGNTQYTGPVYGPFKENDGYYAKFEGALWKNYNWEAARNIASSLYILRNGKMYKGFLATPNTSLENQYLSNNLSLKSHWFGLYQKPGATSPDANWWLLNDRKALWTNWSSQNPDDQKNGAWTTCRIVNFFNGATFTSDGESSSFTLTRPTGKETGCENCGIMDKDGKWNDKECKKHGEGFIVEFRNL